MFSIVIRSVTKTARQVDHHFFEISSRMLVHSMFSDGVKKNMLRFKMCKPMQQKPWSITSVKHTWPRKRKTTKHSADTGVYSSGSSASLRAMEKTVLAERAVARPGRVIARERT